MGARRLVNHIAGIAPYKEALSRAGVQTSEDLIESCQDSATRERVCDVADVSADQMESWFRKADLSRVAGLTPQFIELLEFAGVHSAEQLAKQDPEKLTARLVEANVLEHCSPIPPTLAEVEEWVEEAG